MAAPEPEKLKVVEDSNNRGVALTTKYDTGTDTAVYETSVCSNHSVAKCGAACVTLYKYCLGCADVQNLFSMYFMFDCVTYLNRNSRQIENKQG